MKRLFIILLSTLLAHYTFAHYYKTETGLTELTPIFEDDVALPAIQANLDFIQKAKGLGLLRSSFSMNGAFKVARSFVEGQNCYYSSRYIYGKHDTTIVYPRIILKLKEHASIDSIIYLFDKKITLEKSLMGTYVLDCNVKYSERVLEIVNAISNLDIVLWCEPEMFVDYKSFNTLYSQQYYLNNTGQFGGTAGMDIKAPQAWKKSKGNPNITVAVIDCGVDFNHEDLSDCLLAGYSIGDSTGMGAPLNVYGADEAHGTACAGIIAAINNDIGIRGIASGVKILPVNMYSSFYTQQQLAEAINWAGERADIISCSWGNHGNNNSVVQNAFQYVINYGRNNRGCVVVAAAGNEHQDGESVAFPAKMDDVIAVGAVDNTGTICTYSCRGEKLNLVAFGGYNDIVTTDLTGTPGYNSNGNYTNTFSGTSAACPQVAGVAALMLSINPYLTQTQVRQILQNSAQNLGTSGFDTTYGWGLVDANRAVLDAKPKLKIMGSDVLRNVTQYYYIQNLPSGMHVVWSIAYGGPITITNAGNGCLLTRPSGNTNQFLLYAQVYYDDIYIGNASKTIYYDFTATYDQEACAYYNVQHPAITTKPLQPNHTYFVHQGCLVRLNSPFFQGATITHTGITPDLWYHAQNSSEVQFILPLGSGGVPFVVTANCPLDNSTRYFTFFTVSNNGNLTQSSGLDVMATGSGYRISILSLDSGDGILQRCDASTNGEVQWGLEVIDVLTNRQMLATTVQGESYELDTVGWPHGTYAVRAYVGDEPFVTKILVK